MLDDTDNERAARFPYGGCNPTQRQVTAMTQALDEARLDEIVVVDELSPTTSAIVVLGYN